MTFIKQTLKNTASLLLAVGIIGSAYAAISTVSSGDPLTADSWNQIVNKISNTDTNSDDLVTKSYVDSTVSANSGGGYPVTNAISQKSPIKKNAVQAVSYCNNLTEDGYNDWRLPTLDEIYHYLGTNDSTYLLTTTQYGNGIDYNMAIKLLDGNTVLSSYNSASYPVRCVR